MDNFLKYLAKYLDNEYDGSFEEHCFLFPNRRSLLFFKKYLGEELKTVGWMPEMITVGDFMSRFSGFQSADPLELSFTVYSSYKEFTDNPESFDEFYPWGEMMISDFDDVDKYLVDAQQLFANLTNLKEIDTIFDTLTEEQKEYIQKFWKHFEGQKLSDQKESFLQIWKLLYPIYNHFRESLTEKGIAYEGMMYRKVADDLRNESFLELPWKKVFVIGFNALSKSETELFFYLKKTNIGEFFWDYDLNYKDDKSMEAGRFLRKNIELFPSDSEFNPGFQGLNSPKKIDVYNLPSDILQAKQLHTLLNEEDRESLKELNDTAIILGDETILPAVLTSLPEELEYLNITMGLAFRLTPVYSFLDSILKMQLNFNRRRSDKKFYHRDILSVLNHQYLISVYGRETESLVSDIHRENKIYIEAELFETDTILKTIFRKIETSNEMVDYLTSLVDSLLNLISVENKDLKLEREYIYLLRTRLVKIFNLIENQSFDISLEGFIRIFRKILSGFNIPFQGEPLKGLQLMGILESRLLDFKNLIFLSMNEGVMPASQASYTYIPVNLRYAFEMPGKEEKDAIYAYYFYRLMQRAENISILYNSNAEGLKSGEPSRYIYQLEYLSDFKIKHHTPSFRVLEKESHSISIEKTEEILGILEKFKDPKGEKYLSPSAITSYMDCSLRFYFSYVAGIKEEDEVSEDIDAAGFGSLYHKTMELVYEGMEGKMLNSEDLKKMAVDKVLKIKLDEAFRSEFLKSKNTKVEVKPEGRNIIIYEVIRKMVKQTLKRDAEACPFVYIQTEQNVDVFSPEIEGVGSLHLGGKIDRLDKREGKLHILEYKTGKGSLEYKSVEQIFDRESWGAKYYKGIFQTMFYAWLYSEKFPEEKTLYTGIYLTNNLFKEDFKIYPENKSIDTYPSNFMDYKNEFQIHLYNLLSEIFNPDISFSQTEDDKRCGYCPYAEICHRTDGD